MPKTFPIRLEVEEIALGAVLRKLNDMPGIAKLHLDLGHGGEGEGRKELQQHADKQSNSNKQNTAIRFLMNGPKHISDISRVLGGKRTLAYGVMNQLAKKGLSKTVGGGMHQLTQLATTAQATAALPAPAKIKHGPKGRATSGSGTIVLHNILRDGGPKTTSEVGKAASNLGMSPKSISGILYRAKRDGLIRNKGGGYELTAKGQKIGLNGASANG